MGVKFTDLIHLPTFLITLIFGILSVYILKSHRKTIYVFPTPENMDKLLVKDNAETCFSFKAKPIVCPKDKSKIKGYPLQ